MGIIVLLFVVLLSVQEIGVAGDCNPGTCPGCQQPPGPKDCIYANPCDCATFIDCSSGSLAVKKCPIGLLWNDNNKICDWPDHSTGTCETESPTPAPTIESPTPEPTSTPTPEPTTSEPTSTQTPKPKQSISIYLPNQITSSNQAYFDTRKELNIQIKKTSTGGATPSGKILFYKNGALLGSKILSNGQTKWTISSIPTQFQGLNSIKVVYSGDHIYASKTTVFKLFFFTIPKNGSYLINVNQSSSGKTVTFWNAEQGIWNLKNKIISNIDFYGWANPFTNYNCQTKFNVRNSPNSREIYNFTGVVGIETIGTKGIASRSSIKKIVIVDTRHHSPGVGKVIASFCAGVV